MRSFLKRHACYETNRLPTGILLLSILGPTSQIARAAVFTTPITIAEGDASYDDQDIVIDGTTVTINGHHSFNSLTINNGGVLTRSACRTTEVFKLELVVAHEAVGPPNTARADKLGWNLF